MNIISMNSINLADVLKNVGAELKSLRVNKGYTSHEDFALDHDLSRAQYWRLENGKANFTFKTLQYVLQIHNLSVQEFFTTLNQKNVRTNPG